MNVMRCVSVSKDLCFSGSEMLFKFNSSNCNFKLYYFNRGYLEVISQVGELFESLSSWNLDRALGVHGSVVEESQNDEISRRNLVSSNELPFEFLHLVRDLAQQLNQHFTKSYSFSLLVIVLKYCFLSLVQNITKFIHYRVAEISSISIFRVINT